MASNQSATLLVYTPSKQPVCRMTTALRLFKLTGRLGAVGKRHAALVQALTEEGFSIG